MTSPEGSAQVDVKTARTRVVRAVLLVVFGYLVISAVVAGWALLRASHQANELRSPGASKAASVAEAATSLRRDLFWAHLATRGPVWWAASKLPMVGDDIRAVRLISQIGDDLAHGPAFQLVGNANLQERLLPRDGKFDLEGIASLSAPVGRARSSVRLAAEGVDKVHSSGLGWPVSGLYRRFAEMVQGADGAADAAAKAVSVLPRMLGADGPRRYLLLFGNNAEARATGGQPGAFAVLRTNHGRIELSKLGIPADIGAFTEPVLPQSAAEKAIYFDQLAEYPQDTNFTPEFPRTAVLLRAMWLRSQHQQLNGVLSIDALTLSYLIRATGPIEASPDVTLTNSNAMSELINTVYFRIPTNEKQNAFFRNVATLIFGKLLGGSASPAGLITAFAQGAREGRIYIHDFDPQVQEAFSGSAVAGDMTTADPRTPQVGVYFNDATGSHMSYYLRSNVRVAPISCRQGSQVLSATAKFTYTADSPPVTELPVGVTGAGEFGTPKGQQLVLIRIYGPQGGAISKLHVAGKAVTERPIIDRGRPVSTVNVLLSRGQTVEVTWSMRSGGGQVGKTEVSLTPGLETRPARREVRSACSGKS